MERYTPVSKDHDLIVLCLLDARRTPRLTREKERDLFQQIEGARRRSDEQAERELIERVITANMRFVIFIATRYRNISGLDFLDIVQEGYIGLMRAADTYDWRRDAKFSTYAFYWIRHAIIRAIEGASQTVRLPSHVQEELNKLGRVFFKLLKRNNGIMPTDEELAEDLGWDIVQIKNLMHLRQWFDHSPDPLDRHQIDAKGDGAGEAIADEHFLCIPGHEEQVISSVDGKWASERLSSLDPREAEVIRRYFGIGIGAPEKLEEIAGDFGVTRQAIHATKERALRKLRRCVKVPL